MWDLFSVVASGAARLLARTLDHISTPSRELFVNRSDNRRLDTTARAHALHASRRTKRPHVPVDFTSSPNGECCQIWIDPPQEGLVTVHVAAVEARDDEERTKDWRVPESDLNKGLEQALSSAKAWMGRES